METILKAKATAELEKEIIEDLKQEDKDLNEILCEQGEQNDRRTVEDDSKDIR